MPNKHRCNISENTDGANTCYEDDMYLLWVTLDYYTTTRVNFCPFCGYKALKPISDQNYYKENFKTYSSGMW